MTTKLIFAAADVRRIVEHSLAAPTQRPRTVDYDKDFHPITEPVPAPAIILVHDEGVYLMSNGEPRDVLPGSERSFVAQAAGCDPRRDADWYDTARDLVGGDDFAETLPWAREIKARLDAGATTITIEIGAESLALAA